MFSLSDSYIYNVPLSMGHGMGRQGRVVNHCYYKVFWSTWSIKQNLAATPQLPEVAASTGKWVWLTSRSSQSLTVSSTSSACK